MLQLLDALYDEVEVVVLTVVEYDGDVCWMSHRNVAFFTGSSLILTGDVVVMAAALTAERLLAEHTSERLTVSPFIVLGHYHLLGALLGIFCMQLQQGL
jgi:hypothetical protein